MVEGPLSSYFFIQHSQFCTLLDYSLNTYLVMIIINNYGDMKLLFVELARSLVCVGAGHVLCKCHRSDLHMIFISTTHLLLYEFTSLFCLLVHCTGLWLIYRCSAHNSKPVMFQPHPGQWFSRQVRAAVGPGLKQGCLPLHRLWR